MADLRQKILQGKSTITTTTAPKSETAAPSLRGRLKAPTPTPTPAPEEKGILSKIGTSLKDLWAAGTTPTESKTIFGAAKETGETYEKLQAPETRVAEQERIGVLKEAEQERMEKKYLDEYKKQMDWAGQLLKEGAVGKQKENILAKSVIKAGHQFITGLSGKELPQLSTGDKAADVISTLVGELTGFGVGMALTGGLGIGGKAGIAAKGALSKGAAEALAGKVVNAAVREGVNMALLGGLHGVANAATPQEALKTAAKYGVMGVTFGAGATLFKPVMKAIVKSMKKEPGAWKGLAKEFKEAPKLKEPKKIKVTKEAKAPEKVKIPEEAKAIEALPKEAKRPKFGEEQLNQLDDLKVKKLAKEKAIKAEGLAKAEESNQLRALAKKYTEDRNMVIYGTKEAPPRIAKPTKLKTPKTAAEKAARKMEINYLEKVVKDPKSSKQAIKAAEARLAELKASLEVGAEIFPFYDPAEMQKLVGRIGKASEKEIKVAINNLKKTIKNPNSTPKAVEFSKKILRQMREKGVKSATTPKLKPEVETTGMYKGKPVETLTKKDISKTEFEAFRSKYASEVQNKTILESNYMADEIAKLKPERARASAQEYINKELGIEGIKIPENATAVESANIIQKEGYKASTKKMVKKLLDENPEIVRTGKAPEGWAEIARNDFGTKYSAPNEYIASQLRPLLDTGWMDKAIAESSKLGKVYSTIQVMKETRLSMDFFLEQRLVMQRMANRKFGFNSIMDKLAGRKAAKLDTPEFRMREKIAVSDDLITPKVYFHGGAEERLAGSLKVKGKISKGVKKILQIEEKRMDAAYNRLVRKFKVNDYWSRRQSWVGKHPTATAEELKAAGRKIAAELNASYKGLNYKVLGYTQNTRDWTRLVMLAPDYTLAKYELLKSAAKGNPESISHIVATILGSYGVVTQGLNIMLTGHSTIDNPEGHKMDVMINDHTFISVLPDWAYDVPRAVKQPVAYAAGKSGFWSQIFYTGWNLKKGGWDGIWEIAKSTVPSVLDDLLKEGDYSLIERILGAAGIVRTTKPKKSSTQKQKESAEERAAKARKRLKSP